MRKIEFLSGQYAKLAFNKKWFIINQAFLILLNM